MRFRVTLSSVRVPNNQSSERRTFAVRRGNINSAVLYYYYFFFFRRTETVKQTRYTVRPILSLVYSAAFPTVQTDIVPDKRDVTFRARIVYS